MFYECLNCGKQLITQIESNLHSSMCNIFNGKLQIQQYCNANPAYISIIAFKCSICNNVIFGLNSISHHIRKHGKLPYICSKCERLFDYECDMCEHECGNKYWDICHATLL